MTAPALSDPLTLPCGASVPNRICKAAMTEGLARKGRPTKELERLYQTWAQGGAGLLLTGNVQVDRRHLERPGNIVIDEKPDAAMRDALSKWAAVSKSGGAKVWMQISHAGRQTKAMVNPRPKAPSAVPLALPGKQFGKPVALEEPEIFDIIERFAAAARVARDTGFDGVQIHAAHGYLISQFLSPHANRREDDWGGPLEKRARFLMEVVGKTRAAVGADFPVSVKLNSADFQKNGFAFEDSLTVAGWLADSGVDLLEISGGTYEQPRMVGVDGLEAPERPKAASSKAREAYFLDLADAFLKAKTPPLMVTGGFRSKAAMLEALADGVAMIGVARPLCVEADGPAKVLNGAAEMDRSEEDLKLGAGLFGPTSSWSLGRALNTFAVQFWYYQQLRLLGRGKPANPNMNALGALVSEFRDDAMRNQRW